MKCRSLLARAGLTAGFVVAVLMLGLSPLASADLTAHAGTPGRDCPSYCEPQSRVRPLPGLLLAGESAEITLATRFICMADRGTVRLAVVVFPGLAMDRAELREVQSLLQDLVDRLDPSRYPELELGLVQVADRAKVLAPLSPDRRRFRSAISRLDLTSSSDLAEGLDEARRMLVAAEPRHCRQLPDDGQAILVLSPELGEPTCSVAARAARKLRAEGILAATVCADRRCSVATCLRSRVASSPHYHLDQRGAAEKMASILRNFSGGLINVTVRRLTVVETLGEGVSYLPGSAVPTAELSPDGRRLTWQLSFVPKDGVTMSYRVRLSRTGLVRVGEGARLDWQDNVGREGWAVLDPAWLQVFGPAPEMP